jgi:hypothetical protein
LEFHELKNFSRKVVVAPLPLITEPIKDRSPKDKQIQEENQQFSQHKNPTCPERLEQKKAYTHSENELLGELKKLCKNPSFTS